MRYTIHNIRFIRFEKVTSYFYLSAYDAIGVYFMELPLTPARILEALKKTKTVK